ncbi:serine hydrolase domain-containing protein [Paenibacillus sp. H1-7]|uniref:serine hydrolase domain-containing protein n=1 Tax=Paenibacillus sp. H1-7 TaxID=2282849 RepID=UPI001EF79BEC|nr:serine hydrolase domain-containing protein [Paenibacillus sp. H1-7]
MRNEINDYLRAYEQMNAFSGTVLVARDGNIVLHEGYGMANHEHEVENDVNTVFRIASISKMITAAAILLLHERGALDIDKPVGSYLPEFPVDGRMTIHHLLTHSSGLPNPVGLNTKANMKLEQVIRKFMDNPLEFIPGERFRYANSGYILLTYLIEEVSGLKYGEFLDRYIFEPLGMNRSGYETDRRIVKHKASGYSAYENSMVNGEFMDMSTQAGAAGLYSSAYDLYVWDQALYSDRLLSRESRMRMFTPYLHNYGYGWHIDQQVIGGTARDRMHHGGLGEGYCTRITRFPRERVCVVTLSNFLLSPLERINRDLASIMLGEPVSQPVHPQLSDTKQRMDYSSFAGLYEAFMPVPVAVEAGRLFITIFGFKLELFLVSETPDQADFHAGAVYVRVSFHKNGSDKVTGATVYWLGEDGYEARKSG